MYDAGKIVTGLILFLGLITFPVWYDVASGAAASKPDPVIATEERQCVESTEYMRASHMALLERWRDLVVREGKTVHVAPDGERHEISLSDTCLDCHSNKAEFCDSCHGYVKVQPDCWRCHTEPEEKKNARR